MFNQTSFRLTTTLLPTDTTAKTTTVINKLDSSGNKFYPNFPTNEETVVLTNDDRTIMETTRATCNNGVLTFTKRGLSDDDSETPIANRKLTWNPGTLAFITAGAGDLLDKDDNITRTGNQTYSGNLTSQGTATYAGRLITQKGVEYPHFTDLEALEAYNDPFGGMFAVVDSDGELYRYNAVDEEWSVVTTSTPVQPAKATTSTIGTVRGATDAEFAAGTGTGSSGELLIATPAQILGAGYTVLPITDEYDTVGAQAVLDAVLAGKMVAIKFGPSYGPTFFYLNFKGSESINFFAFGLEAGQDGTGKYFAQTWIRITYYGTTVSALIYGNPTKYYINSWA